MRPGSNMWFRVRRVTAPATRVVVVLAHPFVPHPLLGRGGVSITWAWESAIPHRRSATSNGSVSRFTRAGTSPVAWSTRSSDLQKHLSGYDEGIVAISVEVADLSTARKMAEGATGRRMETCKGGPVVGAPCQRPTRLMGCGGRCSSDETRDARAWAGPWLPGSGRGFVSFAPASGGDTRRAHADGGGPGSQGGPRDGTRTTHARCGGGPAARGRFQLRNTVASLAITNSNRVVGRLRERGVRADSRLGRWQWTRCAGRSARRRGRATAPACFADMSCRDPRALRTVSPSEGDRHCGLEPTPLVCLALPGASICAGRRRIRAGRGSPPSERRDPRPGRTVASRPRLR